MFVSGAIETQRHGLQVQRQFQGDLSRIDPVAIEQLANATDSLVIDHRAQLAPMAGLRMLPT